MMLKATFYSGGAGYGLSNETPPEHLHHINTSEGEKYEKGYNYRHKDTMTLFLLSFPSIFLRLITHFMK